MRALFFHEIRLPVTKSYRYNIEIWSSACWIAHGDSRCHGEEMCVPGAECEKGENLGIPRDCNSNNNSPLPRVLLPCFRDSGFCVSLSKPDHYKFRRNRDCESLGSCDVMHYDLTASHLFMAFNLSLNVLSLNDRYKTHVI